MENEKTWAFVAVHCKLLSSQRKWDFFNEFFEASHMFVCNL